MYLDLADLDTARYLCVGVGVGSLVFQLLAYYGLEVYRRCTRPNADSMYTTPVVYLALRFVLHAVVIAFYIYFGLAPPDQAASNTPAVLLYGQCVALSLLSCTVTLTGVCFASMRSMFINIGSTMHAAALMCVAFRTSDPFAIVAFLSAYMMALMTTTRTYKYKNQ